MGAPPEIPRNGPVQTDQGPGEASIPRGVLLVSTETRSSSLALAKDHSFSGYTVLYLGTTLPLLRSWLSGCVGAAGPSTSAYLLKGRDPVGSGPTLIFYFILRSFIEAAASIPWRVKTVHKKY
jgi:hypothetical protein